jgi:ABC-2 type transport system ATP-binding protein
MTAIVSVKGLTKTFGQKQVLKGLDFDLEAGRVIGLMGPNGAGKTTLIKTLMQIYHASSGEVRVCNETNSRAAQKYISYMPDKNHLFRWMRVSDAIHYYGDLFPDFDGGRARELCSFLQVDEKEAVKNLSRGLIERVLIMLTLARKTRLYLLDEPIGGIDPLGRDKILKTIRSELNEDCSILISTHLVKDVETLVDDVLFLNEGRLIFSGSAETIREEQGKSIETCYLEVFENA